LSAKLQAEITFEAWVKIPVSGTQNASYTSDQYGGSSTNIATGLNRCIVSRYNTTTVNGLNNRLADFNLQISPDGSLSFFTGGGIGYGVLFGGPVLDADRWYHVAWSLTYQNNAPYAVDFWLDWEPLTENWNRTSPYTPGKRRRTYPTQPINLGRFRNDDKSWPNGQYFLGDLDEVRFWDGVKPRDEILGTNQYLLRSVVTGTEPWVFEGDFSSANLLAAYNFNSDADGVVYDSSVNGFHGQLHTRLEGNATEKYSILDVPLYQYVYTLQQLPVYISLTVLDADQVKFNWTNLQGKLYQYNAGADAVVGGITYPGIGFEITNGDILALVPGVVYLSDAVGADTAARFFYAAVFEGSVSAQSEVRVIITACVEDGDFVDYCGKKIRKVQN
jgi:hypothetical protein